LDPLKNDNTSTKYVERCRDDMLQQVANKVNTGIKLYNDQRKAQVFNLSIYLLVPYMFRAFF
jgi:hypothetical protein